MTLTGNPVVSMAAQCWRRRMKWLGEDRARSTRRSAACLHTRSMAATCSGAQLLLASPAMRAAMADNTHGVDNAVARQVLVSRASGERLHGDGTGEVVEKGRSMTWDTYVGHHTFRP